MSRVFCLIIVFCLLIFLHASDVSMQHVLCESCLSSIFVHFLELQPFASHKVLIKTLSLLSLFKQPFSRCTWIAGTRMSPFWILLELRMMEVVVTTGAIRSGNTPVTLSPPTNQHQTFYRLDALPVSQSTVSQH